jgi:hypothetical protein
MLNTDISLPKVLLFKIDLATLVSVKKYRKENIP